MSYSPGASDATICLSLISVPVTGKTLFRHHCMVTSFDLQFKEIQHFLYLMNFCSSIMNSIWDKYIYKDKTTAENLSWSIIEPCIYIFRKSYY